MADINISFNCSDIEAFQKAMEQLCDYEIDQMMVDTAKDVTKSMLSKVKKNTGVGRVPSYITADVRQKYWAGYVGGQLRDSWHPQVIRKEGNAWKCGVENNTKYAIYYEYGHRQNVGQFVPQLGLRLKKPFVEGHYPATKAAQSMQRQMPRVAEKNVRKMMQRLEDYDKDK